MKSRKKGRKKAFDKPKIDIKAQELEEIIVYTSAEHVNELEEELLKLRIENTFLKELRSLCLEDGKNERKSFVINILRGELKPKDLLSYTGMTKSTYTYWQKMFDRENPDKTIEEKVLEFRESHNDYGYRRVVEELKNQGYCVNKKEIQRIITYNIEAWLTAYFFHSKKS